ncbi:MAG TPA: PH domain-containing protein [Candidatus Paceibacterota bacterium]|jgi:membrane protein YdbS with pleckstrin-like domain|nr:PH domain-containing protein [Candidatus Paceibacterota bacterium]
MDDPENIIKQFHPHPVQFFSFYFDGILLAVFGFFFSLPFSLIFILIGSLVCVFAEVSRRAETFYVLESGIERGYRMLSTSRKFIEYSKIQDIEVDQSFVENMFGIGTLKFDTAGSDEIELSFKGAKDPYGIEKIIREKMSR